MKILKFLHKNKYINNLFVDRLNHENNTVICENINSNEIILNFCDIFVYNIHEIREGDVLSQILNTNFFYKNYELTSIRKSEINNLRNKIFGK